MKKDNKWTEDNGKSLRYWMIAPLTFLIASIVACCFSYSTAKQNITEDLNKAIIALANENSELWARQDTVAALRQMHAATHKPLIYQASDVNFKYAALKDEAYYILALVDKNNDAPKIKGDKLASDSIMIVPEKASDGLMIQVQGFADCSMASVFAISDQTLPGILFFLSLLSMTSVIVLKKRERGLVIASPGIMSLDGIKLTPMQRQLAQMLLDAPAMKVDKATLCSALWGNKSNAEESLYTLVKRTKAALAGTGIEIICNRGDSYELRVNS